MFRVTTSGCFNQQHPDVVHIRNIYPITYKDAFGQIVEVAGGTTGEIDKKAKGKNSLRIVEVEFLEKLF